MTRTIAIAGTTLELMGAAPAGRCCSYEPARRSLPNGRGSSFAMRCW